MRRNLSNIIREKLSRESKITLIFFLAFFLLGIFILDDYGMSWDEQFQRISNGQVVHNFVFHGKSLEYLKSVEKYHGPAIEWPLYTAERILRIDDSRNIYLFRHFITFLIFFVSSVFFFKMIRIIYNSFPLAILGTLIYIASPRIFADAFYNSKDVGDLAFFAIGMFAAVLFYKKPVFRNAIFFGLVCGYLVAIRITGIVLPVITIAVFILQQLMGINKITLGKTVSNIFIILCSAIFSMILFWPILWFGPIHHFHLAYLEASHYGWDSSTMFMGHLIPSFHLPWEYLPVWILITTPSITLGLFAICVIYLIIDLFKIKKINQEIYLSNLVFLGCFAGPVFTVIYYNAVLYDGWRHLYFINAPLVALTCYPVFRLYNSGITIIKKTVYLLAYACLLPVIVIMIKMHPYEHVYFNRFAFKDAGEARFKFEMDYWGLSFRKGLEFILETDKRPRILVYVDGFPGKLNAGILKKSERKRLVYVDDEKKAEYFLGNYRWVDSEYDKPNEIFYVKADNAKLLSCFKSNPEKE